MARKFRRLFFTALALGAGSVGALPETQAEAQRFPTPEAAAQALLAAARSGDTAQLAALFGSGHADLLSSGDAVEDQNNREAFVAMAQEQLATEKQGADRALLKVGRSDWPFPIPLVKSGDTWHFDAAQGKQEIIDRRIGRNELSALAVINAYLEAQFEYADIDRDGDGLSEYAQRLGSEPGQFDGLFWEAGPGQPASPFGPLVAEARAQGYRLKGHGGQPTPYHGYYYRILTRQGADAPGGKYDYIINGNMIAGFGLVAFPAEYGSSGIMTFIVNHQGQIHQKNLGPNTREIVAAIKDYDPDASWMPVATAAK